MQNRPNSILGKVLPALAISLLLTACGTTTSLQNAQGTAITPTRKFTKVSVLDFKLSVPNKEGKATEARVYFPDRIAAEIRKAGKFSNVTRNGKPDANTLVIDGVITKFEEGNPTLRFFIGMGAGSAFFESDVYFRDSKGTIVGKIKVDKNSWALGGGIAAGQSPQSFMDGAAGKVAEEAAKVAR